MNDLINQMNVIASAVELIMFVTGTALALVLLRLIIDLLKGES